MNWAHTDTKVLNILEFWYYYIPPYGYNMQIFSVYRPMISVYTSNFSNFWNYWNYCNSENTIADTITIATLLSR